MKRITPESVVDAYIATGTFPIREKWATHEGGCCGLGALYLAAGGEIEEATAERVYPLIGYTTPEDQLYATEFSAGFSAGGHGMRPIARNREDIGYLDGRAAYEAVTAHFAKAPAEQEEMEHAY
jgi:hypothetical protein